MQSPRISDAYDSLGIIGHGPLTTVFKCRHKATQEVHVIKEYLLDSIPRSCVSLLRREADLQAQVEIDSITQPCYTFVDHDSLALYIVLPFLEAKTLAQIIEEATAEKTYFTEDVIWNMVHSVLMSLRELSFLQLHGDDGPILAPLHCNIKPSNILFLDTNLSMIQLCDCSFDPELRMALSSTKFGIKRRVSFANNTYEMTYAAPEILNGKQMHKTSDIWSLGCIIYEMCTFSKLFPAGYSSEAQGDVAQHALPIRKLYGYSDALLKFVNEALTLDMTKRPTCEVLLNHEGIRRFTGATEPLGLKSKLDNRLSSYSAESTVSARSNLSANLGRILPRKSRRSVRSADCTHLEAFSDVFPDYDSFATGEPLSALPQEQIEMHKITPLIDAVIDGNRELLLKSMSFAGCTDEHGKTALMYAAELSRNDFILYLLPFEKGRQVDGITALQLAIAAGNDDGADMIACYECPEYAEIQELCSDWMNGKRGAFQEDSINVSFVGGRVVPESKTPTISLVTNSIITPSVASNGDNSFDDSVQPSISDQSGESQALLKLLNPIVEASVPLAIARSSSSQKLSAFRACASRLSGSRGLNSNELGIIFQANSTSLMQACAANDIPRAWCLRFQAGARTAEGKTALMFCAESNCILMARVLLETEAGLLLKNGTTAYELAFSHGHTVIAQMLYKHEVAPNITDRTIGPLIKASILGDISIINYFINHYRQNIKAGNLLQRRVSMELLKGSDHEGKTALMYAAEVGNVEVVQLLRILQARQQMSVNSHLKGRTALMFAARKDNLGCIYPLIQLEARMQDARGWTALMMGAYLGYTGIVRALLAWEHGLVLGPSAESPGATALMLAAEAGNTSVVALLLSYEARKQKDNGFTALMIAAQEGHSECVRLLAKRETRLTRPDGWTALMSATQKNRIECVKILMAHEAGMQKTTGYTALMCAAQCGWNQCVRLLLPLEWGIQHSNGLTADSFAKTDELRREIKLYIELRERHK